ncbi:MAG: response regulator transcription factor [Lachnospiraceae bacterium]|nr:response regulator transcription factor [Lachnospiraceae bacterium]
MTHVMIVEDQELQRKIVKSALEDSGRYRVLYEVDSADVCDIYLLNGNVDLVLMDIFTAMGADGIEAAERIKSDYPEVKVIIITSSPETEWIVKAKQCGVESFWFKEVNADAIISICDRTMAGESVYP